MPQLVPLFIHYMKKFIYILKKKITVRSVLSILISISASIVLKLIFEYHFYVIPVKGGLNIIDITFVSIIIFIRFLFDALLELYFPLEDKITLGTVSHNTPHIREKFVNFSSNSNNESSSSSNNPSSSNPNNQSSSNPNNESVSDSTIGDERRKLAKQMMENSNIQRSTIFRMWELKTANDLKYFLDKEGNLSLEAPSNTSDEQLERFSKEVAIMDRIINTKFSEYKSLSEKDALNHRGFLSNLLKSGYNYNKNKYNNLFEKDE